MLEHADAGSAVTFPPPPPPLVVVAPLLDSLPPPPHPAATNASAAKRPTNATALTLLLTLPPPVFRLRRRCSIGGVSGLGRLDASQSAAADRGVRTQLSPRTMERAPKWRNWQTRRTQNPVPFGECGFDSHLRHRASLSKGGARGGTRPFRPRRGRYRLRPSSTG